MQFLDPFNGGLDAVLGSLQGHLVALNSGPWEADNNSSKLLPDPSENLSSLGNKMLVELGVDGHGVLDNVVQLLDLGLHGLLGALDSLLGANDHNGLFIRVIWAREYDPGSSIVSYLLDVDSSFADKEFVMLRLGLDLHGDSG